VKGHQILSLTHTSIDSRVLSHEALGGVSRRGHQMELEQPVWRTRVVNGDSPELRKAAAALALALLLLNVLDVTVTNFNIKNLGAVEMNPLMAPIIGTPWATVFKVGIPITIIAMATWGRSFRLLGVLRIVVVIYLVVVISGLAQIVYAFT
jgi:hypothetical protein